MVATSRRAFLALGAAICCPTMGFAASIEPILRNPGVLIADVSVTWSREYPRWAAVAEALSSYVYTILREEVRRANLPLFVARRLLVLDDDPYLFSPLSVRVGMKLRTVPGAKPTMGTVSLSFERLGFETVRFAQPATRFLATNDELANRSAHAIREQLAAFVGVLAAEDTRPPDFVKSGQ
jgi:hypothetical protein